MMGNEENATWITINHFTMKILVKSNKMLEKPEILNPMRSTTSYKTAGGADIRY